MAAWTKTSIHSASVMAILLAVEREAFLEQPDLADDLAEQGMAQRQHEGEPAAGAVDMADRQRAGAEPARQAQPKSADGHEIVVAAEMQRLGVGADRERDAEPAPQALLEPGRPGETLADLDALRKVARAVVLACRDLAGGRAVLRDRDAGGNCDVVRQRQGRADHAAQLRDQLAVE